MIWLWSLKIHYKNGLEKKPCFVPSSQRQLPRDPVKTEWLYLLLMLEFHPKSVGLYYIIYYISKTVRTTTSKMIILHPVGNMISQECLKGISSNLAKCSLGLVDELMRFGWSRWCHKNVWSHDISSLSLGNFLKCWPLVTWTQGWTNRFRGKRSRWPLKSLEPNAYRLKLLWLVETTTGQ